VHFRAFRHWCEWSFAGPFALVEAVVAGRGAVIAEALQG
jgi:hypothetical protein